MTLNIGSSLKDLELDRSYCIDSPCVGFKASKISGRTAAKTIG